MLRRDRHVPSSSSPFFPPHPKGFYFTLTYTNTHTQHKTPNLLLLLLHYFTTSKFHPKTQSLTFTITITITITLSFSILLLQQNPSTQQQFTLTATNSPNHVLVGEAAPNRLLQGGRRARHDDRGRLQRRPRAAAAAPPSADDPRREQRRGPRGGDQSPQEAGGDVGAGRDALAHWPPPRDGRALQHFQVQQAPLGADIRQDEGEGFRSVSHHVHR